MDDTTSSSMWPVTTADSCGGDFWAVQSTAKGGVNGYIPLEVPHIAPLLTLRSRKGIFHEKGKFLLQTRWFLSGLLAVWKNLVITGPLEKFADVGSLQKAIWWKMKVFWPSEDREDICKPV